MRLNNMQCPICSKENIITTQLDGYLYCNDCKQEWDENTRFALLKGDNLFSIIDPNERETISHAIFGN